MSTDWISKFEDSDRQKAEVEKRRQEQDQRNRAEEAARFEPFASRLGPRLEQEAADVARRLGIRLKLSVDERKIILSAPRRHGSILRSPFPFYFSLSESDGHSVKVCAIDDQQINRNPELMPDDMTAADYFGTLKVIMSTRETLDDLESGDLARLMEWLVEICRSAGDAPAPQLRGAEREQAWIHTQAEEKKRKSASAGWCLFLGILGMFFILPGPFALIWGISIRRTLIRTGQSEGRTAVAWAIGLGVYTSCVLIIGVVSLLVGGLRG